MSIAVERESISKVINIGNEVLYLSRDEVMQADLSVKRIIELTKTAMIAHGEKKYEMPAKIGVHPFNDVFYHAMPAYVPSAKAVGVKWIECYPSNPRNYDLPQTTGLLILNDVLSGCPVAIMDATWITAMRTPAVTALAASFLHPTAETFGMFGSGIQGIEHCRFIVHTLKNLKKIYIFDINAKAMDKLINIVQPQIDVEIIRCKEPEEVVKHCQIMSSATIILHEPQSTIKNEWVSTGQTILPCDLNTYWDPLISLRADKYIVDSIEEHQLFASMGYFPDGLPKINCETGEVIANIKPGRDDHNQLIVCSNIGMAVCDVVVAKEIFDCALRKGLGFKLLL
jgi:ornithine cyclodeaminase/alanine dehydrogenase-like protein (mu-crystallin family)